MAAQGTSHDMSDHAAHLQAILDAAMDAAKAQPSSANISAVESARKALDNYASVATSGEKFSTQTAALEYLQRTYQIEKSKLSKDCGSGKVPRKDGLYHAKDLDFYAEAVHLKPKTSAPVQSADGSDRLKSAMAEEREIRVSMLKGNLIDAAEEEARDARLWFAVRTDIENHGPAVINELVNRVAGLGLPEDITARILALVPELRLTYEDALAEIFDRYATSGGIEA
jgi:hypothetical protein